MKKSNLFFVLLTALIVMSCSKDETTMSIPQESNAIEFGTYVGRDAQTRASVFTTHELASQGFGVFGYYTMTDDFVAATHTTPNFMNNQKVAASYTDTGTTDDPYVYTWTYSPIKYWPNNDGDKVTFLAYAPWVKDKAIDKGKVDFTVENEITAQTDLVWNTTSHINKPKAVVGAAGVVNFTFGHALARIGLLLEAAVDQVDVGGVLDENTTITVNSVTFSESFYTGGTLDLTETSATWASLAGTQGFVLDYVNPETETDLIKNDLKNNVITGESHKTPLPLNTNESYLMVIPQDFSSTGFNVTVDYNVVTKDLTTDGTGGGGSDINNTITRTVNLDLLAGKAYTLKLHVGMNSVDITATVAEWGNGGETVVNVPINTPNAKFSYSVSGLEVTFTNESQGATSYVWDFGNGTSSTDTSPTCTYSAAGTYTVKLSAKDANEDVQNVYQKEITVPIP